MPIASTLLRLLGVAAMSAAPAAALDNPSTPNIATGDAVAVPADGGVQNTGGNVEIGTGESSSTVVAGDPAAVPAAAAPTLGAKSVAPTAAPKPAPGADAVARAKAVVEAARARAQAAVDAARAQAERAVEQAHQQADAAQANAHAQSGAASANAQSQATSSHS